VSGHKDFAYPTMPKRYTAMITKGGSSVCFLLECIDLYSRAFLLGCRCSASARSGKPMTLQNICDRIGGSKLPVRRNRKEAWKPNNDVYRNWKTERDVPVSCDQISRKTRHTGAKEPSLQSFFRPSSIHKDFVCMVNVRCSQIS
jgi:hypothetical protein